MKNSSVATVALVFIALIGFFYVLFIGTTIIIPFLIALLLSMAIIGLSNFYKSFSMPGYISFPLSIISYILIFWLIAQLINANIDNFIELLPVYQEKVSVIILQMFDYIGMEQPQSIQEAMQKYNIKQYIGQGVTELAQIVGQTGIILFYTIFILLEYRFFSTKLEYIFQTKHSMNNFKELTDKIRGDIKSYFVVKGIVSFFVGLLSFIIMLVFGIELALFFAFIVFLLNFIPNIGSIIAVMLPFLFSLVQFNSISLSFIFLACMIGAQVFMGNIIEPKFMGNKLNLSPLVIITGLIFWGILWGVPGMLLSVPIMVIINIILAKIPQTRWIAILMSEKGELQVDVAQSLVKKQRRLLKKVQDKLSK